MFKRIKNLWRLSGMELQPNQTFQIKPDFTVNKIDNTVQIISRKSPVDEFIEKNGTK